VVTRALTGRWLLPVATLFGVLAAAVAVTLPAGPFGGLLGGPLGGLLGGPPRGSLGSPSSGPVGAEPVPATGTVIGSQPCGKAGARDNVVFVVDGRSYELPLDACGNPAGIQLDVELVQGQNGEPAVRLAGSGAATPRTVVADRAGAVLLVLAGLAGALLVAHVSAARARERRAGS
jgi:hypothetical protein